MGLDIQIEDEECNVIEDANDLKGVLYRFLPDVRDKRFGLIRFIDIYGRTVFNQLQLPEFLEEWSRLYAPDISADERSALDLVADLARRSMAEPHLYLCFAGD